MTQKGAKRMRTQAVKLQKDTSKLGSVYPEYCTLDRIQQQSVIKKILKITSHTSISPQLTVTQAFFLWLKVA
jgi:hypothetical protein